MDITKKRTIGYFAVALLVLVVCLQVATAQTTEPTTMPTTAPMENQMIKGVLSSKGGSGNGIATQFWVELKPFPPASQRLWLFVGKSWYSLDKVDSTTLQSVQQAFAYPAIFQTQVWYKNGKIVGLVVNTK